MGIVDLAENLLLHAGTAWVLWLLVGLSVISLVLATERGLVIRTKRGDARSLAAKVTAALGGEGGFDSARAAIANDTSTGAEVLRAGLRFADGGVDAASHAMSSALVAERSALESRVAFLGTLGNNAPFIGLFGTVIGIVSAFDELGRATTSAAATQMASAGVMAAIAEALVATAVGIGVALPAVAAYNVLQRSIAGIVADTDSLTGLLLAHLARRRDGKR